jgi:hypothetical protein
MRCAARTVQFLSFLLLLCFQSLAAAQQETPFQVGPFGAIPEPVKTIRPSRDIASLLPRVAMVRVLQNTKLSPAGETTVVYDMYEPPASDTDRTSGRMVKNAHLVIVRDREILSDLGAPEEACDLAGFAEFRPERKSNAAAIAFRCGGDGSHTDFFLLRFDGQCYSVVAVAQTVTGRMEILETEPAEIRVWSAGLDDTCVWCAQHYSTDVYIWENGQLAPKSHEITHDTFQPADLNQHPIIKSSSPTKSTS